MKLIVPFFLLWIVPTILFFYFPLPLRISSFQLNLTLYLFTGGYLFLASTLSYRVILNVFEMKKIQLSVLLLLVLAIFTCVTYYKSEMGPQNIVLAAVATANLLFGATILGALLSVAVKRVGELVPVCLTAVAADVMSVYKGPTKAIAEDISKYYSSGLEGRPPLVDSVLIKAGVPGFEVPVPLFGVSDWILLVVLSSALLRLNKTDNLLSQTEDYCNFFFMPVTVLALYASIVTAQITHIFLPAMVFICTLFLLFIIAKYKVHLFLEKVDYRNCLIFPTLAAAMILLLSQ